MRVAEFVRIPIRIGPEFLRIPLLRLLPHFFRNPIEFARSIPIESGNKGAALNEERRELMTVSRIALAVFSLLLLASPAAAQTVVQLPNFAFTTVNTTVTVPDQGHTLLGSVNRSREGSVTRGVPLLGKVPFVNRGFKNRGIGRDTSALQMRAHATIINLDELDEAVLNEAASRRLARGETLGAERFAAGGFGGAPFGGRAPIDPVLDARAGFLARNVGRGPLEATPEEPKREPTSPEDIRRKNEAAKDQRDAEAVAYFEKAEAAVAEGKTGVAKIYFGMAAKRATGDFKSQVTERLDALNIGVDPRAAAGGK